jgi:hypothetical protein
MRRKVAVKLLHSSFLEYPKVLERFRREALAQSKVKHPNLLSLYDCDIQTDKARLVLEYVQGLSLAEHLNQRGHLCPQEVLRLASHIGGALDALHAQGVLHRDLKPANLMVRARDKSFVLMDLGLVSLSDQSRITDSGYFLGTPAFWAPESVMEGTFSQATDLFQLGSILFEASTGLSLLPATFNLSLILQSIHSGKWRAFPPETSLPPGAQKVILRAVSPDPSFRPTSGAQLAKELAEGMLGKERTSPPKTLPSTSLAVSPPAASVPKKRDARKKGPRYLVSALLLLVLLFFSLPLAGNLTEKQVSWKVVGDHLVITVPKGKVQELTLLEDGGIPRRPTSREGQLYFLVAGLQANKVRSFRLVWKGGSLPWKEVRGEPIAISNAIHLEAGPALRLKVLRPVTAHWKGTPVSKVDLTPDANLLPLPSRLEDILDLRWKEEGIDFFARWRLTKLIQELRVLSKTSEDGQSPLQSQIRRYRQAASWTALCLASKVSKNIRFEVLSLLERHLARLHRGFPTWRDNAEVLPPPTSGSHTLGLPKGPEWRTFSIPITPDFSISLLSQKDLRTEIEKGWRVEAHKNSLEEMSLESPAQHVTFLWPQKLPAQGQICLAIQGRDTQDDEGFYVRAENGEFLVRLWAPPSARRQPYRIIRDIPSQYPVYDLTWFALYLPADLAPPGGTRMEVGADIPKYISKHISRVRRVRIFWRPPTS